MKIKASLVLLPCAFYGVALAQQQAPAIGELFAADGNAQLVQPAAGAGMSVVPGSELAAGVAPARLKLYRGGQVRICHPTNMTVNSGRYGLMFGMGSGMLEFDYTLTQRGADFVLTPDFSIQLSGPGKFHFALGANKQGDTCIKSLAGNGSPIQVSELLSSATYRVRPQDSISFHAGKINGNTILKEVESCGCPEPSAVMQAAADTDCSKQPTAQASQQVTQAQPVPLPAKSATDPIPEDHPGQVHVQVDTPFVFSAKDANSVKPYTVAKLSISSLPNVFFVQEKVEPIVLQEKPALVSVREEPPVQASAPTPEQAPQKPKKEKKGFFGKLKGLFGGMFGR